MMLERVIYLNIHSLYNRSVLMERNFNSVGVPHSCRERFIGIDGKKYADMESILEAAPDFFRRRESRYRADWGPGTLAQYWGMFRIYEGLASTMQAGSCALVLLDDAHLVAPWHEYVRLAWELPEFDLVQLFHWDPADDVDIMQDPEWYEVVQRRQSAVLEDVPGRPDFTSGTHYGGCHAWMVSPAGARKVFEMIQLQPYVSMESQILWYLEDFGTVLSAKVPEAWIEHAGISYSYRRDASGVEQLEEGA